MPPVFKMLTEGTSYRQNQVDATRSVSRVRGHVTGLSNNSDAWQVAINTAIAAMATAPSSGLPIQEWESRVFKVGTGSDGEAIVDGYFSRQSSGGSAGGGGGAAFDSVCDVTVGVYPFRTCEAVFGSLHNGNIGSNQTAKLSAAQMAAATYPKALTRSLQWRTRLLPEWDIRVPIQVTTTPITWSTGLVGKVNSNTYTLGKYLFPIGSLRHDGVAMRAYTNDGGLTYVFKANVTYTARPFKKGANLIGFIDVIAVESGGDWFASSELAYDTAAFTDPPGV